MVFGGIIAVCGYGFYKVGQSNLEQRLVTSRVPSLIPVLPSPGKRGLDRSEMQGDLLCYCQSALSASRKIQNRDHPRRARSLLVRLEPHTLFLFPSNFQGAQKGESLVAN